MALLVSFYAVLLVNMNAIDTKTEDLKNIPTRSPLRQVEPKRCSCVSANAGQPLSVRAHAETVASVKRSSLHRRKPAHSVQGG